MKKIQVSWKQLVATLLIITMFLTSVSLEAFATENTNVQKSEETALNEVDSQTDEGEYQIDKADIIQSEMTTDSTTYNVGNGKKITEFYSQDVRFEDEEGKLVDYDPTLIKIQETETEQGVSLKKYAYENKAGDKKQYFPEELTVETPILMEYGKYQIRLSSVEIGAETVGVEETIEMVDIAQLTMENSADDNTVVETSDIATEPIVVEKETITDIYEKEKTVPLKAVYLSSDEKVSFQYTSTDIGIKEEIVLEEIPGTNVFTSIIEIPGLTIRENATDEGLTVYDGDDIVAGIMAPNMNDATGEAYSESATYDLAVIDEEAGKYQLILTVDEEYLKDEEREYPVTIDPTITWSGNSKVSDVYVLSGSSYKDLNFYDSGITAFHAGKVSQGISRTYLAFASISSLYGRYVESAKLVLTEAGSSDASQTVNAYRVTKSWSKSTVTWNNKPSYNTTVLSSIKTKGTTYTKYTLNLTTLFRGYAKKSYSNYGILLKNPTETGKHGRFFGSRHATSSYRPKLTIVHYDPPTVATSLTVTPQYVKEGSTVTAKWAGITSQGLSYVQYRLAGYDHTNNKETGDVVSYSSSTKLGTASSGSATITASSGWAEGAYKFVIRGVDKSGIAGTGKGYYVYVDGTAPTMDEPVITPATTEATKTDNLTPTISWSNAADKYFKQVECKVDDGSFVAIGTTASGTYTLPEGSIESNGEHTITVRAIDKAGYEKSYALKYYVHSDELGFDKYLPKENSLKIRNEYGKNMLSWETINPLSDSVYYRIYRGETEDFTADENSLIVDKVKGSYWTDIQSVSDKTYHYKIEVIRVNADGTLDDSEMIPTLLSNNGTELSALQKRTGSKNYLGYYSFSTPIGNGTIEKSEGNLCYSQEDVVLSENQLTLDVTRTYNSQSSLSGMFGEGWSDSLHKELLKDAEGNIYFMDSDGTVYTFTYNDGSYTCAETKEYEIKSAENQAAVLTASEEEEVIQQAGVSIDSSQMGTITYAAPKGTDADASVAAVSETAEDEAEDESGQATVEASHVYTLKTENGLLYRFNEGGQLVSVLEPNGTFLLYQYTEDGRLLSVQTQNDKKLVLAYDADGFVTSITLPDETLLTYSYEDGKLAQSAHSSKDQSDSVWDSYEYAANGLVSVTDRKGNQFQITYAQEKAVEVTYPNEDKYTLAFGDGTTYVTFPNGKSTCTVYDSQTGKVTKEIDVFGEVTAYEYGFSANPYLVTKTIRTIGYEVITDGKVEFKTAEKVTETSYNEEEQVTSEVSEDGTVTEYTYGEESEWAEDLPTEIISLKDGETLSSTETDYDDEGNVKTEIDDTDDENISVTENVYDEAGNMIGSTTTEDGIVVSDAETSYDKLGNVVTESTKSGDVVNGESNTYDSMGRVLKTTDTETGEVTAYTYDYLGRVIKTESTVSEKTLTSTSAYDANGTVISETDTNGVKTTYEYDAINRVVSRTVSKDSSITYTTSYSYGDVKVHDGRSENTISNAYIEKESYPDGKTASEKYYDANGRVVKEKAGGLYVDYTYDAGGNQVVAYSNGTEAESEEGRITLTLYDQDGQQTATIENPAVSGSSYTVGEDTVITTQTYDAKGNVETETDAEGIVTAYAYDDSSRITQVTQDANGEKVITKASYTTDAESNHTVTAVTDAEGHVSEEILDAAGLTKSTRDYGDDSESIGTSYEYDSRGNLIQEVHENGAYKTYTYNKRHLLITTKSFNAEDVQTLQSDYTYDDKHRLIKTIDSKAGETSMVPYRYSYTGYDAFGRTAWTAEVDSESEPVDDVIENHKITYTYDAEDKVTDISYALVEADGVEKLHFVYDDNRWLETVQAFIKDEDAARTVREYTYDNQGKVSEIKEYPDFATDGTVCITKTYTYDDLDQVVSMVYKKGADVLESYSYQYDKNGNITEKTEVNNTPSTEADKVNETKEYTYDTLGRLIKTVVTDHLDADAQQTITYEYDKAGNRTKKTSGSTEVTYTYNGLDQLLTAVTTRGGAEAGTSTYTYDENGNQIKEVNTDTLTTTVNVYDEENRLSKVTITSPSADSSEQTFTQENLYNGEGQRIQKKEGAKVTNYFYQDGVVSYTTDASDDTKVIQNLLGLEGNVISAERKLETTEETGDTHNYYLYNKDIQGSTVSILDETGDGELSYEYDDFGETEVHGNSSLENEICYTGGIYDASTGLYYLNARYYDPVTGRFLTEDAYRGELDEPDTLHLYAYCKNNPVNYVDPSGHAYKKIMYILQKDVTKELNKFMKKNATTLENKLKKALKERRVSQKAKKVIDVYKYFVNKVKTNGDWDLKRKEKWKLKNKHCFIFRGKKYYRNDALGNIHFGYTGAVLFKKQILCAGAGLYQVKSKTSSWKYILSWGDDPYDNKMIKIGYDYYKKDRKNNISTKGISVKKI